MSRIGYSVATVVCPLFVGIALVMTGLFFPSSCLYAQPSIRYAAPAAQGSGNCADWGNACTLRTALTNAVSGDEIWIKTGVHYPGAGSGDSFTLKNGVALYGGFAGNETNRDQRNWQTRLTVLSGDLEGNDLTDANGVVTDTANINGSNASCVIMGGGTDNTAVLDGLAITAGDGSSGGGMYNGNSSPTLTNVIFSGNRASNGGGMFNINSSNPKLTNITFKGNSASGGGGMYNHQSSSPTLTNVIFSGNSGVAGGGMANDSGSNPTLTNVTFGGNTASSIGGGIYNYNSNPTLANVILWGDSAPTGAEIANSGSIPAIFYSDIQGCGGSGAGWSSTCGTDNGGNIDSNPMFMNVVNNDLRLNGNSPALDAGDNTAVPSGTVTDLDGNPRFVDMATVPDTGKGTAPIVDMGAYESKPNQAPFFTSTPVAAATEGLAYNYAITTDDPDVSSGDSLTITAPTLPGWLHLTDHLNGTATLEGTPSNAEVGQHSVVLRVTDSANVFVQQEFIIIVVEKPKTTVFLPLVVSNVP